jgi:hypothetical protein
LKIKEKSVADGVAERDFVAQQNGYRGCEQVPENLHALNRG